MGRRNPGMEPTGRTCFGRVATLCPRREPKGVAPVGFLQVTNARLYGRDAPYEDEGGRHAEDIQVRSD